MRRLVVEAECGCPVRQLALKDLYSLLFIAAFILVLFSRHRPGRHRALSGRTGLSGHLGVSGRLFPAADGHSHTQRDHGGYSGEFLFLIHIHNLSDLLLFRSITIQIYYYSDLLLFRSMTIQTNKYSDPCFFGR